MIFETSNNLDDLEKMYAWLWVCDLLNETKSSQQIRDYRLEK